MTKTASRPASVCDTGSTTPARQIADRHVGSTRADTAFTPAIARQIITTYTAPGDTVCDPNPGPGLVLAEAIRAGRDALGLPTQPRWESVLEANLDLARLAGPIGSATLLDSADDRRADELPGAVDLVLTGLRHSPASDPSRVVVDLYEDLVAVADWVWPGGHIVVTCRSWRRHGRLLDLPSTIHDAAEEIGLVPADHCIALTTPVRGHDILPETDSRYSPKSHTRDVHRHRLARAVHLDVLVFRIPSHTHDPPDVSHHIPREFPPRSFQCDAGGTLT